MHRKSQMVWVWVVVAGIAGTTTAWAASGPFGSTTVANKVLIVLDPNVPTEEVQQNLASSGFSTLEKISGLPPRFTNLRLVSISSSDTQTRAKLQQVPGVRAVRSFFQWPFSKDPVIPNGQIIARFNPGTTQGQVATVGAQAGLTIERQIQGLPQAYVFNLNDASTDPEQAAAVLRASGQVVYSHPSLLMRLQPAQVADTIDDPLYVFQWHLHNTGQLEGGVIGADLKAQEAWAITKGEGAVAAVIDECIQKDHEDLKDNYITGFDFLDQDGDPSPAHGPDWLFFDNVGDFHGTCVSGIICARDNHIGVRGVAPRAGLIGCKIGLGFYYTTDQDVADAFLFAERNGAMVINNSWGLGGLVLPIVPTSSLFLPDLISDAIDEVSTNGRGGKGVLVAFASGNFAIPIDYGNIYASLPNVMAVGASMRDETLACYSDYGPQQSVVAPGGGFSIPPTLFSGFGFTSCFDSDITTTDVHEVPGVDFFGNPTYPIRGLNPPLRFLFVQSTFNCPNLAFFPYCLPLIPDDTVQDFPFFDYTHHMNGTSAACPNAVGVASLVYSVNSNLTAEQVRNLIEHTADKVTSINELFDPVTGHNERYGHGRVNAFRAATAAVAGQNWPSPVSNVLEVSSQSLIRIQWDNPVHDFAGALVVRSTGGLNWTPVDGIAYAVGQQVAPNVIVVADTINNSLDQTGLPSGTFSYAIFAHNASSFYAWGRRTGFSANSPTEAPRASISASPKAGSAPLVVHFAGGGTDQNGIVSFAWNFGDGQTGSGATLEHTYTAGGTYNPTLTVTNQTGQTASTSVQIKVSPPSNALPAASIVAIPTTGAVPLVVLFEAAAQDADGQVQDFSWNFGDGSSGAGQVVEHVYLIPGTYGVSLTVTDNQGGLGTAAQVINVTGSAPTASATDPPGLLNGVGSMCGRGTTGAAVASMAGLVGLTGLRRRRRV